MTGMMDREKAFEAEFANKQEAAFRAKSARNRLAGLWAAEALGLTPDDARAYADSIVSMGAVAAADETLVARLAEDFQRSNVALTPNDIRAALVRFAAQIAVNAAAQARH